MQDQPSRRDRRRDESMEQPCPDVAPRSDLLRAVVGAGDRYSLGTRSLPWTLWRGCKPQGLCTCSPSSCFRLVRRRVVSIPLGRRSLSPACRGSCRGPRRLPRQRCAMLAALIWLCRAALPAHEWPGRGAVEVDAETKRWLEAAKLGSPALDT